MMKQIYAYMCVCRGGHGCLTIGTTNPRKKQKKLHMYLDLCKIYYQYFGWVGVATSQNWEFLFKKHQQHLGNPKNLRLDVFA